MTDEPQPDLREQLAEALRTTPSVLMDTPEERDRHAATPRNHHISHHYYWGCAVCRGEVDTLADALLAVVQPELDRLTAERDQALTGTPLVCADDRHRAKVGALEERLATVQVAGLRYAADLEEIRDLLESNGHNRVHGDDWPDIIPALTDLVTERDQRRAQLDFLRDAVDLIRRADISSEQIWLYLKGDQVTIAVNVSDVFAWGGSDAEDITPERLPILEQAWLDCKAVDAGDWTVELYAARVRGMRPQGADYPKEPAIAALFDACGPERPTGLGNPRKPPVPSEESK